MSLKRVAHFFTDLAYTVGLYSTYHFLVVTLYNILALILCLSRSYSYLLTIFSSHILLAIFGRLQSACWRKRCCKEKT